MYAYARNGACRQRKKRMSEHWPVEPFKHLVPGRGYVVVRSFVDYDQG